MSKSPSCYASHPAMPIGKFFVYGGSCITPAVKDADIYIGFDFNMAHRATPPWHEGRTVQDVYSYIQDMDTPKDAVAFSKLVEWAADQIRAGKKVHAGCIGGHGRTGLFFAALVTHMTGEQDSIPYTRKHYCSHAVETLGQAKWLNKYFGVNVPENFTGKMSSFLSSYGNGYGYTKPKAKGKGSGSLFGEELDTAAPNHQGGTVDCMAADYSII